MTRITHCLPFVLLFVCLSHSGDIEEEGSASVPFEEDEQYFCYQNVTDAANINGKIYVKIQNFQGIFPPKCDSAERVQKIDDTHYIFTLAAEIPKVPKVLVKFNTSVVLSKTGNHTDYNAMTYRYTTLEPPMLRKLMYLSPNKTCMIFAENRNSSENAQCQLFQPAEFANDTIPADCAQVYRANCPGPSNFTVYNPECQSLREIPVQALMQNKTTTSAPEEC
ncbi:uncharacterized protein [Dermacentor albipictus]|uniref:uncharacterized protein n=1 Tax=Dermacentor albipictus TaxID=60249 RepID=UPI0038FC8F7A